LNLTFIVALIAVAVAGCSSTSGPPSDSPSNPTTRATDVSFNKDDYPVFPGPDSGADPAVPAEQGGKGFTGEGWETNTTFDLIGDPRAVKGGMLREVAQDFPTTLRPEGPNTTAFNSMVRSMVYETLLNMHPTTFEYMPALATHWQISPDKTVYRFRIDPNARWSDGAPVVAGDVVASWSLWMDKGMQDPMLPVVFGKFEKPVAESKYVVRVKALVPNWRNFMYFAQAMYILPAHALKNVDGATFIRDYNYKIIPGSGPYTVSEQDVDKGKTIRIRRRSDYWGEKQRRNVGLNNFDELRIIVVRDRNLEFEMFKKGELDFYAVNRAQMWAEELNFDTINRGLILKRRIWNHSPNGQQGFAINTRRPPFNDVRVRKALRHLFNRELMIEKMMFGAYMPMNSSYPGSVNENPNNEKIKYDPQAALRLLAEAGWKDRDARGRLTKNGVPLSLELLYYSKDQERYNTIFQEDLGKVGITLNLRLVTPETMLQLVEERQFEVTFYGFTGLSFPNPETSLLSSLADQKNNNNITGFKNKRVDELIAQYDLAYEIPDRIKILREIDGLYTNDHHWIYEWYAPYHRVVFWNKFGAPKGQFTRTGDYADMVALWWIDPDKSQKLDQARADTSINLGQGEVEDKYWLDFDKVEENKQTEVVPR
jgi:microcin C transport system substrate-binding protein